MAQVRLDDFYDVKDLALEMGATVQYTDGRRFNTAGVQAVRQPKQRVEAKPQPAPAPPPPPTTAPVPAVDNSALIQQLIAAINRPVNVTIPDIPPPQVTVQSAAPTVSPTSWVFDFERNSNGTIKRIHATPSKEK